MATAAKPRSDRLEEVWWAASRVPRKTRALSGSSRRSTLTIACSRSLAATTWARQAMSSCACLGLRGRDADRVARVLLGELDDRLRERRREEDRPALGRGGGEDRLQLLAEPHVEHLVRLVEHEGAQVGEVERAALG